MSTETTHAVEESTAAPTNAVPSKQLPFWRLALGSMNSWRKKRPLWGALILSLGGYFVMAPMVGASFRMVAEMGMRGASPYLLGGGMILAAVMSVILPAQRHFPAIMAMALAVLSLPFANLGGWIIGLVLGIVGSGLIFAWTPYSEEQIQRISEKKERRQQRKAARSARA